MAIANWCHLPWSHVATICFGILTWGFGGAAADGPLFSYDAGTKVTTFQEPTKHQLHAPIKFYGETYHEVYVSPDGLIGFSNSVKHHHTLHPWDLQDPFIAPFYYLAEKPEPGTQTQAYIGEIWIEETLNRTFLEELSNAVNENALGVRDFHATFAVLVTWENVTDSITVGTDQCHPIAHSPKPCNSSTFQAVIVASEKTTAVIFNYASMDVPCTTHCGAGINGGRNRDFINVLPCQNNSCIFQYVKHLHHIRGTDMAGRFLFLVSGVEPLRGGCVDGTFVSQPQLDFYPRGVSMLGGDLIDVTPLCPMSGSTDHVRCTFGGKHSVTAFSGSSQSVKARCAVPRMTERGDISLTITVSQRTYQTVQPLTVILPSRHGYTVHPRSLGWNETEASELKLGWKPTLLSNDPNSKVDIFLVLYREDASSKELIWKDVLLASDVPNVPGQFSMRPAEHRCQGDDCSLFEVGLGEVRLRKEYLSSAQGYSAINSRTIPLGWWMADAMRARYGDDWPAQRCKAWYDVDTLDRSWETQLLHCPCTLHQALTDFGRWQPDSSCNMFKGSVCTYHRAAKHCVRSVQPSKPGGHGNQCCYQENGALLYAADTFQGSTPDRGHDWGAAPYGTPGRVPSLSHWVTDVVTFYYCCLWDDYRSCDYYMDARATRDCKGYTVPKSATAYGDPHITTFDGNTYTMSGKGDFWLLQTNLGLKVQVKMQVVATASSNNAASSGTRYNGTGMTAMALQKGSGPVVVIRLQDTAKSLTRLDVVVGGRRRYFLRKKDFWQDFQGMSVLNNAASEKHNTHSNFTVIFSCGAGVTVAAVQGLLYVTAVVPPQAKSGTSGLMGSWDDNADNDFQSRAGVTVPRTADTLHKYKNFGLSWEVTEAENLFPADFRDVVDKSYVPTFPEELPASMRPNYCMGNVQCELDAAVTGNKNIAMATKNAGEKFTQIQRFQHQVLNCGWLPVARAVKTSTNYSLGSTVSVTGCRNGVELTGEHTYTCVKNDNSAEWKPAVTASCLEPMEDAESIGMIIGIVVAVVVFVLIAIFVALVFYRQSKSRNRDNKKRDAEKGVSSKKFDSVRYEPAAGTE